MVELQKGSLAVAIFKRTKSNGGKAVSKDVQKYYKSGKRERVGLAWLVAFVSLIITIAVVMGLFFGGRWIYRQITGDDEPSQPTTQEASNTSESSESSSQNQDESEESSTSQSGTNQQSTSQPSSPTGTSSTSTQTPSTSNPQSTASPTATTQMPANTGKLNSTGPEHNAAIFVAVTIIGTILHNRRLRRRANQA